LSAKETGGASSSSDSGAKIVELEKNVIIDSPDAIVRADKANYNTETKKIKAWEKKINNIWMKYEYEMC
jgi:lipopolysaccharide export system protein LptA